MPRLFIGLHVDPDLKEKLAKKANRERRSLASMCELLLIQGTNSEVMDT